MCAFSTLKVTHTLITMGVKDCPQCYFDVELNREPGKNLRSVYRIHSNQSQMTLLAKYIEVETSIKMFKTLHVIWLV